MKSNETDSTKSSKLLKKGIKADGITAQLDGTNNGRLVLERYERLLESVTQKENLTRDSFYLKIS